MKRSSAQQPVPARSNGQRPGADVPGTPDSRVLDSRERVAVGLLALLLLAAPLWAGGFPTPPGSGQLSGTDGFLEVAGSALLPVLAALALVLTAVREWRRPVKTGSVRGLSSALALGALWAALSAPRAGALALSLTALCFLWCALLLGGLIARLGRDRQAQALFLCAFVVAGSVVAGIGVRQYLEERQFFHNPTHRTFATFANPDFLAGYLLLTLPLAVAVFVGARDRLITLLFGLSLALQSVCLFLTGSRAGIGIFFVTLIVWAVAVVATRAAAGSGRRIAAAAVIVLLSAIAGAAPARFRLTDRGISPAISAAAGAPAGAAPGEQGPDTQSHSAEFRKWTWRGTIALARAHPVLGSGIGTFDVSYPRYATTAYTAHAHNSYLQLAAEIGAPGLLLFLTGLAAGTAFGAYVLLFTAPRTEAAHGDSPSDLPRESAPEARKITRLLDRPHLILAGLLAAVFGSLLHSLIDSDWYIVAIALTLSACMGLLTALARDLAPFAVQPRHPIRRAHWAAALALALFLVARSVSVAVSRLEMESGTALMNAHSSPERVVEAFDTASAADPWNPEPHLALALVYQALNRPGDVLRELKTAVRLMPGGRTSYRLGRFHMQRNDFAQAVAAFQKAQEYDPSNVQTLEALASALRSAGRSAEAKRVYGTMVALEEGVYGRVRAMPEIVETQFGAAHKALAEMAEEAGDLVTAEREYGRAVQILRGYWPTRNLPMTRPLSPVKKEAIADMYDTVLTRQQELLRRLGDGQSAGVRALAAEQTLFRSQRAADAMKAQSAP